MTTESNFVMTGHPGAAEIRRLLNRNYRAWVKDVPLRIEFRGSAGGFSGALFWQIEISGQSWCLRRWPAGGAAQASGLRWQHRMLNQIQQAGFNRIPVPLTSDAGETLVSAGGAWWQLEPWLSGELARAAEIDANRFKSAIEAMADFHQASSHCSIGAGSLPALRGRLAAFDRWWQRGQPSPEFRRLMQLAAADSRLAGLAPILESGFVRLADEVISRLRPWSRGSWETRVVHGDLWSDHVLFCGDEVSGLVDFGALKRDHVSLDFARLRGSLAGDCERLRRIFLAHYRGRGGFSDQALELADGYEQSATLLTGLNWLSWICVENRQFAAMEPVLARIQAITRRMETLVNNG